MMRTLKIYSWSLSFLMIKEQGPGLTQQGELLTLGSHEVEATPDLYKGNINKPLT